MNDEDKIEKTESFDKLPEGEFVIGAREISKGIAEGKIVTVVIADNCPDFLLEKLKDVKVERFVGNQKELGTKLGKPFPVAMIGYKK